MNEDYAVGVLVEQRRLLIEQYAAHLRRLFTVEDMFAPAEPPAPTLEQVWAERRARWKRIVAKLQANPIPPRRVGDPHGGTHFCQAPRSARRGQ
jgi:hypothetical protein